MVVCLDVFEDFYCIFFFGDVGKLFVIFVGWFVVDLYDILYDVEVECVRVEVVEMWGIVVGLIDDVGVGLEEFEE